MSSITQRSLREMEALCAISACIILLVTLVWAWKMLIWSWLKPKKLERVLREQGLKGNPYRFLVGDMKDYLKMEKEVRSKPLNLSDDIVPRVFPYGHQSITNHGNLILFYFNLASVLNIRNFFNIFNINLN